MPHKSEVYISYISENYSILMAHLSKVILAPLNLPMQVLENWKSYKVFHWDLAFWPLWIYPCKCWKTENPIRFSIQKQFTILNKDHISRYLINKYRSSTGTYRKTKVLQPNVWCACNYTFDPRKLINMCLFMSFRWIGNRPPMQGRGFESGLLHNFGRACNFTFDPRKLKDMCLFISFRWLGNRQACHEHGTYVAAALAQPP